LLDNGVPIHCFGIQAHLLADSFADSFHARRYRRFLAELADRGLDEDKAVDFELQRGEFSLHDGRLIHGAKPNTSDLRRTGYTMRYFPASVKVLPVEQNAGWRIWLARGEDSAGNVYEPDPRTKSRAA
jgi:phytanoyl-CoA dioxygenase PhyH